MSSLLFRFATHYFPSRSVFLHSYDVTQPFKTMMTDKLLQCLLLAFLSDLLIQSRIYGAFWVFKPAKSTNHFCILRPINVAVYLRNGTR